MVLEGYLYAGECLCSLCGFSTFGTKAGFSVNACHLLEGMTLVVSRAFSLLCGCHSPVSGRICSPVFGVKSLRVRFNKALLPLNVCSVPKDVTSEVRDSVNLCAAGVGIHGFAQK